MHAFFDYVLRKIIQSIISMVHIAVTRSLTLASSPLITPVIPQKALYSLLFYA